MKNYYDILDDHSSDEDLVINNNVNAEEAMGYPNQRPNPDPRYNKGSKKQSSEKLSKPIDNPANDEMKLFQKIFKIKYGWNVKIRSDEATEPNKDWLYIGVEEDNRSKKNKLYLIDNKQKKIITQPVVEFNKVISKIKNGGHSLTMYEVDVIAKVIKKESTKYKDNYLVKYTEAFRIIEELIDEKLKDPESVKTKEHTRTMNALFKHLIAVELTSLPNLNQQINIDGYERNIKPIIKKLASIFLIHSEYFGSVRHTAISICEEILLRYETVDEVSNQLYYALANLHSYADAGWRREKYKLKLKNNKDLYDKIQKNNEASHNGLRRFIEEAEIQSNRKRDSYSLNVFDIKLTENEKNYITTVEPRSNSEQNLATWNNVNDFSVITGVNGIGKTKILDSIHEAKKAKMEEAGTRNEEEALLKEYHLYADSESNILRNVFGRKGYDFKYEYVYEKLIFYILDTDDYVERESVTKRAKEDINCKIALVLADEILCKMIMPGENKKWKDVLRNFENKAKLEQESELKSIISEAHILDVAEHLVFIQNAIVEPMAFAKHLCFQHLQIVTDKFSSETSIAKEENNPNFDKDASQYCKEQHRITPPIEIINNLLKSYLPNFIAEYKYIPYARFKFTINKTKLPRESEIVILLDDNKFFYKVNKDKKNGEIHNKDNGTKGISDELYNFLCNADSRTSLHEKQKKEIYDFIGLSHTPGHYEFIIHKIRANDNEEDIHPQNLSSGELVAIKILLWSYVSRGLNFEEHKNQLTLDMLDSEKLYVSEIKGDNPKIKYEFNGNIIKECIINKQLYALPTDSIEPVISFGESKNPDESTQNHLIKTASLSLMQKNLLLKYLWPNKLKLVLLDEIDKHFDPKLSKAVMDILRNEFVRKNGNVQIIMTTHRLDTVALVPEGSIFTIEQDNNGIVQISKTHPLLAMFRLTGNLREFINFHVKVHVEAPDDMQFYEGVHKALLHYCEEIRQINLGKVSSQEMSSIASRYWEDLQGSNIYRWNSRLLSKRYQPFFTSTAADEHGSGGGKSGIKSILPRELVMRQKQSIFYKQKDNPTELIDPIVEAPFAIMDGDYDGINKDNIDKNSQLKGRVVFLKRHSLENYLFDPWVVFSLISKEEIKSFFGLSEFYYRCRYCIEYIDRIKVNESINDLGNPLRVYIAYIFKTLLDNLDSLEKPYHTAIRICQIICNLKGEKLFNAITHNMQNIPHQLFKIFGEMFGISLEKLPNYNKFLFDIDYLNLLSGLSEYNVLDKTTKDVIQTSINDSKKPLVTTLKLYNQLSNLEGEQLFDAITNTMSNIPKCIFDEFVATFKINKEQSKKYKKFKDIIQSDLPNPLLIIKNAYLYLGNAKCNSEDIVQSILKQEEIHYVIYNSLKPPLKFAYPSIFLRLRGHDFEDIILNVLSQGSMIEGQNFKNYLLNKLYTVIPLCIPLDLANVFFELNNKLREQIYPILKGVQLLDKVETTLLHLEIRAKTKLADTHRIDIPYSTTEQALSDHLQGFSLSYYREFKFNKSHLKRTEKIIFGKCIRLKNRIPSRALRNFIKNPCYYSCMLNFFIGYRHANSRFHPHFRLCHQPS